MKVHYFQHVPFEGLGCIGTWLAAHGIDADSTRFDEAARLPAIRDIDLLIVLGGPMSANDAEQYPWLAAEKSFIRTAIREGKRVLGICLGAQLIASALGARVYRNAAREIGWHPIASVPVAPGSMAFQFPSAMQVFHWHGERFDLPAGSVQLARSVACEQQAFQLGARVMGLQFHLETTPASARALVTHCPADVEPGTHVQSAADILAAPDAYYATANAWMGQVLAYLSTPDT
jgi:GMP synthase-like glutamine amidotransferase